MVANLALTYAIRTILYSILLILSIFFGNDSISLTFIFIINLLILNILIWTIPKNLNWSLGLYNHNLYQIILSAFIVIFAYSLVYYNQGVIVDGNLVKSYANSLHLSISMFCCLGYGQVFPSKFKLASSTQSIIGILYLPLLAAYIWMHIQNSLRPESMVESNFSKEEIKATPDLEMGILRVIEDDDIRSKRNSKFKFESCKKCCNSEIDLLVFIDPREYLPLKKYLSKCNCGNIGKIKSNAFLAVQSWNEMNKKKSR